MTLASEHSRLRGSCQSRRPSRYSRVTQTGSWWLTSTASWPSAARRARPPTAPQHPGGDAAGTARPTTAATGWQVRASAAGAAASRRRPRTSCPAKWFAGLDQPVVGPDRQPVRGRDRRRGLLGPLQRRRRRRPAMSWPAKCSADALGHLPARARTGGSRAAGRTGCRSGLYTSPWRTRWTTRGRLPVGARSHASGSACAAARAAAGSAAGDAVDSRRRRGPRTRTTPRTPTAAGRRPAPASRGRTAA